MQTWRTKSNSETERERRRKKDREREMYNKQMIYSINNEMVIVAVELFAKDSEETHDQKKQVWDRKLNFVRRKMQKRNEK